ncbi:hypothetical protein BDV93DRAFT_575592 [Ceratobasidium sp. AG-I]|nr:hypothetical protein BDV93DRAFT_575592 [Ceratobasidium sp. AG-I]
MITSTFAPFTISPVVKVFLNSIFPHDSSTFVEPPRELVFKVYDRRFAPELRKFHEAGPVTYESEGRYLEYVASGSAPQRFKAICQQQDVHFDQGMDDPPELVEHLLATILPPYFDNEFAVYKRLSSLQEGMIPNFYGITSFINDPILPGLDVSVRGILVEFVPGVNLCHINPLESDLDTLIPRAIRMVQVCGDLGVLNQDVRLENFIVKEDGSGVTMIDFAQSRLRGADESDEEWSEAKWNQDEEGAIGYVAQKKFGWKYVPNREYIGRGKDVPGTDVMTVRAMLRGPDKCA